MPDLASRHRSVALTAAFIALTVALAAGLTGLAPATRVAAAPCDPSATPPPGPTPGLTPTSSDAPPPIECEVGLDPDGSDHASGVVDPGYTVSTDTVGDLATPDDPVETRVVPGNAGLVTVDEIAPVLAPPTGYAIVGQQVNISAPDAVPPGIYPIQIEFFLDSSLWPGVDPAAIRVVRDGLLVPECDNRSFVASPDPCELFFSTLVQTDDRWINVWTTHAGSWLFVVAVAPESSSGTVTPGGVFTTDPEADGATLVDPIETTIQSPAGGAVSIAEGSPGGGPPSGFLFVGQEVTISAPTATATLPLRLTFLVDASLLSAATLEVFRDGVAIADCTASDGTAIPDPCVAERTSLNGDGRLVILTSHASRWNVGVHTRFAFDGFFQPVDNIVVGSTPVLNKMQAGAAVPVKFSLGADQGLGILGPGSPSSRSISCASGATIDQVETTTNDLASGLRYDGSGRYTYIWKTDKGWNGTCRRLTVRLIDGSTHSADFSFKK